MVSSTPRPHFTPGKDPVTILQEAGLAPGPVWMGGKSRPHRDSIPDRPARSQSLYRLSYRAHPITVGQQSMWNCGPKRTRLSFRLKMNECVCRSVGYVTDKRHGLNREKNQFQCQSVRQKYHLDRRGIEPAAMSQLPTF